MQATVADGTGETATDAHRTSWLLRHAAVCVALTALAFQQAPGLAVADTKVDLVVNPTGWLGRSLHLWDPFGAFGQLQNQAYGYLWPMGPFFAAGSWLGMPAWVIQRLWWALLLCVAYTGLVRLSGRLNIGTPTARLVAGLAFALSPRILTQLGWSSVEAWPSAVAPWVLIPLIGLAKGAPLRRAVAGSALAVACAGGVNATAVFAVVPLALLWLATLRPLRRRLVAIAAWCGATVCATAWWIAPLLLLGRYSPPFLDYIESASVTTSITDFVTVLRGASYWVAYLGGPFGPALPAGAKLGTDPALIVATITVAGLGVLGLSRRGMPHRRFLVGGLVLGAALVGLGHAGDLPGTFGGLQRDFLDGMGAPLRNVHKFDVLLRLPLALGLAHVLGMVGRAALSAREGARRPARTRLWLATTLAVAAVAGVASPALAGQLAPSGVKEVPGYWRDAAHWLDGHAGRDRVLVVPAARFPSYDWGSTTDEITQPLLQGRWAVRNAIPFTPPTTIRLLDAVESALSTGAGSAGLADLLARSGISYVLFRGDLDYGRSATAPPLVARQALSRSPGLSLAASFGPVRGGQRTPGIYQDHGVDVPMRALEVFRVERHVEPVVAFDASDVTTVVGGPESLLEIAAAGQLTAAPTVLAGDLTLDAVRGPVIMADGLRRRDVSFGQLRDTSATLTADDAFDRSVPAHDYLPAWSEAFATTVRYSGISSVQASSSRAQVGVIGGSRPEHQPFAALDGDATTSWQSAPGSGSGQWLDIGLERPRAVSEVRLQFDLNAAAVPTKVTVRAGAESATVESFGATMVVKLPGVHATRTVEITFDAVIASRQGPSNIGISEIEIPGLTPARTLAVARVPTRALSGPPTIVLSAAPSTPACFFIEDRPRCSAEAARGSEDGDRIDRTLTVPAGGPYLPSMWVRPRPGAALNAALDQQVATEHSLGLAPTVTASSTAVADPAGRPGAVLDGDPTTAWAPAGSDKNPMLHLAWPEPRVVAGLRLALDAEVAATRPGSLRVIGDDGVRGGFLDKNGVLTFDKPMRTDEITIIFLDPPSAHSRDAYRDVLEPLPIAVGELTALPDSPQRKVDLDMRVVLPCGSGPSLEVAGNRLDTKVTATRRDLLELREVTAEPCFQAGVAHPTLTAGEQRVIASASAMASPTRLSLAPESPRKAPTATAIRIESWSSGERVVYVDDHSADRIIAVRENTNPGWKASISGRELAPIVIDGWQQGWLLPAHASGEVVLRFAPENSHRAGLLVGAGLLIGVVLMALWPSRRIDDSFAAAPGRGAVPSPVVSLVVGGAALIMLGGVVGGLIVTAGVFLALSGLPRNPWIVRLPRRSISRAVEWWLPAALVMLAGWLYVDGGQPHVAAGPQLVGLLALGSLWLSTAVRRRGARRQPERAESLDREVPV